MLMCRRFAFRSCTIYHQCILFLSHAHLELQNTANEKERQMMMIFICTVHIEFTLYL